MFTDNAVVKNFGGEYRYDRFALASTFVDVTFKDADCSLVESQALNSCEHCNLKCMCSKIDELVEDYTEKTTVVTDSFNFNT